MPLSIGPLLALSSVGTGGLLAAAATAADPSSLAPWVQGGGSAAAVAGLVYVARMIVKGELVPRPVKDSENQLSSEILAAGQREAKTLAIAEDYRDDHRTLRAQHDRTVELLTETKGALRDAAEELQYWREMRDRGTKREDRGPTHRQER